MGENISTKRSLHFTVQIASDKRDVYRRSLVQLNCLSFTRINDGNNTTEIPHALYLLIYNIYLIVSYLPLLRVPKWHRSRALLMNQLSITYIEKRRIATGIPRKSGKSLHLKVSKNRLLTFTIPVCICTSTLDLARQLSISSLLFSFDIYLSQAFIRRIRQIQNEFAANGWTGLFP